MGNPHAIVEHPAPADVVRSLGPAIETAARFPERTNVEFVRAEGPSELTMRVWERGVGETLACGTGACAAAVAAVRLGGLPSPVTVHLAGGDLEIAVDDDLEVTMTGPAEELYRGELSPGARRARWRSSERAAPSAPSGSAGSPRTCSPRSSRRSRPRRPRASTSSRSASATRTRRRPAVVVEAMREQVARPGHPPVPVQPRPRELPRGGRRLLRDALRRRPSTRRPRSCPRSARRRPSPTSTWPSSTPATSPWRATPATPSTPPARCWPAPSRCRCRCCPSWASSPTWRRSRPRSPARARLMFLNYPNNPTGGVIEDDFFERAVAFARRNDVIVVHDNAYSEITYDGYRAPSFLETPGAMDVGIEIFSLSKTYNMTGWRAGAVVGNADLVARLLAAEDEHRQRHVRGRSRRPPPRPCARTSRRVAEMCAIYQRRRDVLVGRPARDRPAGGPAARARSTSGRGCPTARRRRRSPSGCSRRRPS